MKVAFGSLQANSWGKTLLRHLGKEIEGILPGKTRPVLERVRDTAQQIFDAENQSLPDKQARMILGMCAVVLAAYRELVAVTEDAQRAYTIVEAAYRKSYQTLFKLMYGSLLVFRDPVRRLSGMDLAKNGQRIMGASMSFGQQKDANSTTMIVTRCAFHQFFVDHGEPSLTRLICAWDRNWMDVLNASKRPIRIERPSTISTGAEACHFRFVRDTDKRDTAAYDVIDTPVE
jgi:hypothetical protein